MDLYIYLKNQQLLIEEQAPQKNDVSKLINPLNPKRNLDPTKLSSSVSYSKFGEFECSEFYIKSRW